GGFAGCMSNTTSDPTRLRDPQLSPIRRRGPIHESQDENVLKRASASSARSEHLHQQRFEFLFLERLRQHWDAVKLRRNLGLPVAAREDERKSALPQKTR